MWETQVWSRGWEDTLEKEMATHSNTLAWKIPWTEEHGRLQPMRSQRVRHNWANSLSFLSFCFIDYVKAFVWITTNSGKFFKRWEKQTTLPASWDNCVQVKKQQLEPDIKRLIPSWERSTPRLYIAAPLIYITWNTRLVEAQAGIKIGRKNINNLRYADDTTLIAESKEELKSLLIKVKEESEKVGLKLNIQ